MSFLSRKPPRPGDRGGDPERGDEYGSYDYAADGYRGEDDEWSPEEYFSPEGIKGHWAGQHPEGRSGGRGGQRDGGRGEAAPGSYPNASDGYGGTSSSSPGYNGAGYNGASQNGASQNGAPSRGEFGREPAEYGSDGYRGGGPGGYGADEYATGAYELPEGADGERPERGRRRRKDREDRGERTGILWLRRDRGEDIWPDDGISDEDYWASVASDRPLPPGAPAAGDDLLTRPAPPSDQRGAPRGVTGRLGPPPGLAGGDYQPGDGLAGAGSSVGNASGMNGSGPMRARPASGPNAIRIGSGPLPSVGVTSSRPPTGPIPRSAPGRAGSPSGGLPQASPRPSFQPNGYQPASARPQERPDWGERTERIERVNASGYPDQRPSGRGGHASASPGPSGAQGSSAAPARGWDASGRGEPRREPGDASGAWPGPGRNDRTGAHARNADDDPLTSSAYSRSAGPETDGRSYRAAASRSQAQPKLTEQAENFLAGPHQTSDYPTAPYMPAEHWTGEQRTFDRPTGEYRTGESWLYRDETPEAPSARASSAPAGSARPGQPLTSQSSTSQPRAAQSPAGRYPGYNPPSEQSVPAAQPARSQPAQSQSQRNSGRVSLPGTGSFPAAPYEAQPRSPQPSQPQQPPQPRLRSQPPSTGVPTGSMPLSAPTAPRPPGGPNPYDSSITGSHPYPAQPYSLPQAPAPAAPDSADGRYYWPAPADGSPDRKPEQARPGYTPRDNRY